MQLEQSFEVDAPIDQVWAALVDVERVAPCLPGATVTGRNEDGSYNGSFTIKIGPTTASYTGKLEMQNLDESTHRATMHAHGSDRRGQGGATATIVSTLSQVGGRTLVQVATDYHITGRLARFGRGGMIEDISERLLREFAGRLQASLTYSSGGPGGSVAEQPESAGGEAPSAQDEMSEQPTQETPLATESLWPDRPAASQAAAPDPMAPPTEAMPAPLVDEAPTGVGEGPAPVAEEPRAEEPPTAPPAVEEPPAQPVLAAEPPAPPPPSDLPVAQEPPAPPRPPDPESGPPPPPPPAHEPPRPPPPPLPQQGNPVEGLPLIGGVLLDRVKRNPAPVVGIIGGLLLLRLVLRRR